MNVSNNTPSSYISGHSNSRITSLVKFLLLLEKLKTVILIFEFNCFVLALLVVQPQIHLILIYSEYKYFCSNYKLFTLLFSFILNVT